jgi:heterodisulfide reductase subunit B
VNVALFLGCSVPVRAVGYEMSVRCVARRLGIELADVEDFGCCGYPVAAVSEITALSMAARNLAVACARDLPVVCLCSACSGFLREAAGRLESDEALLRDVNETLSTIGMSYETGGSVEVKHVARLLLEDVSLERIEKEIKAPLKDIRVAVHYGCHYLRPRNLAGSEEDPENPGSLDRLVGVTGGAAVPYEHLLGCCGGGILGIKEETALLVSRKKLDCIAGARVDAMVTVCPFCSVMFEGNQKKIEKMSGGAYNLPVLYYPQLLGLAMGIDPEELGFSMNRIKAAALLEKVAPR